VKVIEKINYNKIKNPNIVLAIILAAIVSVPTGVTSFAQGEVQLYEYCEPGYTCFCIESSGTWVGGTTGFRINTGCTSDDS
jgi:hypothetical protein